MCEFMKNNMNFVIFYPGVGWVGRASTSAIHFLPSSWFMNAYTSRTRLVAFYMRYKLDGEIGVAWSSESRRTSWKALRIYLRPRHVLASIGAATCVPNGHLNRRIEHPTAKPSGRQGSMTFLKSWKSISVTFFIYLWRRETLYCNEILNFFKYCIIQSWQKWPGGSISIVISIPGIGIIEQFVSLR